MGESSTDAWYNLLKHYLSFFIANYWIVIMVDLSIFFVKYFKILVPSNLSYTVSWINDLINHFISWKLSLFNKKWSPSTWGIFTLSPLYQLICLDCSFAFIYSEAMHFLISNPTADKLQNYMMIEVEAYKDMHLLV